VRVGIADGIGTLYALHGGPLLDVGRDDG